MLWFWCTCTQTARKGANATSAAGLQDDWLSRFQDAFFRCNHQTVTMVGQAGGGFVFDTNALHMADLGKQGAMQKNRARDAGRTAIVLECATPPLC